MLKDRIYDWAAREYFNNPLSKAIIDTVLKRRSRRVFRSIDERLAAKRIDLTAGGLLLDIGANVGAVSEFFLPRNDRACLRAEPVLLPDAPAKTSQVRGLQAA